MKIKNLEELIKPTLKDGQKYVSYECERLLSAGENYGNDVLKIEMKILNSKNKEETILYVGKTAPPSDLLWQLFNVPLTFKTEVAFYFKIVPTLNEYGREKGIDKLIQFVTKPIAARLSLDPKSDIVDKDCLLIIENNCAKGYSIDDRFTGFNLDTTKLVLRDLAVLHATAIAYKLEKPNDFAEKIQQNLNKGLVMPHTNLPLDRVIEKIHNMAKSHPKCVPFLPKVEQNLHQFENKGQETNELYRTIAHNDYWVNNTMLKFENGKAIRNKIIDYQLITYDSLAHDILFLLYSSVDLSVLEEYLDELMKFYFDQFIDTLKRLNSDTSKYTYEDMLEEFGRIARHHQFSHIMIMLSPIFTLKEKAMDLENMKLGSDIPNRHHENFYRRMEFVILDFAKRNWI